MTFQSAASARRFIVGAAFFLLAFAAPAAAQRGSVSGVIVDAQTGEALIGATVQLQGTTTGATADLDGKYLLQNLAPGAHTLVFSYISYASKTVQNVRVEAGKTTTLDLSLDAETVGLEEVVVEARAVQNTEASLLRIQAKAPAIMDGLSAQQIRRSPDANSGEALRRVTGVSLVGGRFVYVRGIPERYNAALLNGATLASSEPDRRAFAFDLLPTNLLENIVVLKSATPDLPGDFSGGLLRMNTIDFPERLTLGAGVSTGFSSNSTFKTFQSGVGGGALDFIGIDDGARSLPESFPTENLGLSGLPTEQVQAYARDLPNTWKIKTGAAPVNTNLSLSFGNSLALSSRSNIGLVAALSYRNNYNSTDIRRKEIEGAGEPRFDYSGVQDVNTVTWGGIFNVSYRINPNNSVSFKNLYTRTADDEVSTLSGFQYADSNSEREQTAFRYVERDVYSGQLIGEHQIRALTSRGVQLRWEAFNSTTHRNEPDYRRAIYERPIGSTDPMNLVLGNIVYLNGGGRFYSDMVEATWGGGAHLTVPITQARFTFGATAEDRNRDFNSRFIGAVLTPRTDFNLLFQPLDEVFAPESFGARGFTLSELNTGGAGYDAGQTILAGYGMVDMPLAPLSRKLRFVGGLRAEQAQQRLESTTFTGPIDHQSDRLNLLPSANFTYAIDDKTNLRLGYSRNLNRPELRELAPFAYYDYELQTTVYGNADLEQARIDNFDARFEVYPGIGQLLSTGVFYKRFRNAIERVIVPGVSLNAERTFSNAETANNYGVEVESRIGLGRLGSYFAASNLLANYTWVDSNVDVKGGAGVLARSGRPLQGQSAYVVNVGLNFLEPSLKTSVSLLYNRIGSRIIEVATNFEEDIIEAPRDVLDLVITQPLMGRFEARFAARDILAQDQRFYQGADLVRANDRGGSYTLGVSVRL